MFIPYGKNLLQYDVNSLYPHIMNKFLMPSTNVRKFEGNILEINKHAFGIFEAKITCPTDLKIPVLQTKVKVNGGIRTISPTGTWTGSHTSEELKLAIQHGYSVEVLRGYTFDQRSLFKSYVDTLYKIKQNTPKSDPMYLVSKLLLNSLYGKFGMNPNLPSNIILSNDEVELFIEDNRDKFIFEDIVNLNNGSSLIVYSNKYNEKGSTFTHKNINVAIASYITSYARIFMYNVLTQKGYKIYYMDTDSVVVDKPIDNKLIHDSKLGLLSLDLKYDEFVAIAPKVYGGIGTDSKGNKSEFVKIKGFKNSIPFSDLKKLLVIDSNLTLNQEKWYKDFSSGSISIIPQQYLLSSTENKRKYVVENNTLTNTVPYNLKDGKIQ